MSLPAFFWRYARHYVGWGLLAGAGIVLFAAATAATASLIKPIFAEVLLAGDRAPDPLGGGMAGIGSPAAPATGTTPGTPTVVGKAAAGGTALVGTRASKASPSDLLARLKQRFNLSRQLDRGYASLKRRLGVGPAQVVYFVPILVVMVFFLRSFADFLSGYAFQRIGFGITTDIRNDLYGQIIDQSSRFHADHTSGELVSRVVSDVALMQSAVSNRLLDLFQQTATLLVLLVLLLS
ncbi:MAG TPA: ABC transporter transmembrane domain-containing protein, partial [Thermoanaerobaculia bacterium]|nr:ABC transporter transmembrane domain-containing protein [Thermoanaerobaculia bacterium]